MLKIPYTHALSPLPLPPTTGRITHYGRAELKQSDHRPVLAVIEVEGCEVDDAKLTQDYESVVASLGPSDCTVVVQVGLIEVVNVGLHWGSYVCVSFV